VLEARPKPGALLHQQVGMRGEGNPLAEKPPPEDRWVRDRRQEVLEDWKERVLVDYRQHLRLVYRILVF
jgi:hypothetical protein